MYYKKEFSKKAKKEFAQKMQEIEKFCDENGIIQSSSSDSYYFSLNGQKYRVSNHSLDASNRHAFNEYYIQVRDLYHPDILKEKKEEIQILASKTRIIEIYTNLKNGKKLNKRGYVIND